MKNRFEKLHEVSGSGEFFLYPAKLAEVVRLPAATKTFLTKEGIPAIKTDLINLYNNESKIVPIMYKNVKYLVIGDDFGTSICVREETGSVFAIDLSGDIPERFVNSDIEKMLSCLATYFENLTALQRVSDEDAGELVGDIKETLQQIDPPCLNNEENWWSVLLEQTELGLM